MMVDTLFAIVGDDDQVVVNIEVRASAAQPPKPAGHSKVLITGETGPAEIGGTYDPTGKVFVPLPPPPPEPLSETKARTLAEVDALAEVERQRWITAGDGQDLVYEAKRQEAVSWAALPGARVLADYPWMRSRAARFARLAVPDVTEAQMQAVADEWLAKIALWRDAGIAIEAVRERAKEAIAAASDAAGVQAVIDGLAWP